MKVAMTEHIAVRSFWSFIAEKLPAALASVAPLSDYRVEPKEPGLGRVTFSLGDRGSQLNIVFDDLPFPREDGSFLLEGQERAVVMTATSNNLEEAKIDAVGEQLMEEIGPRLAAPPAEADWDEAVLRAWFPLDRWLRDFLLEAPTSQWLDTTNPLARFTHLRRIYLTGPDVSYHLSHLGRACPFETPEGPNCGRVLTLASGADVRDGKIIPAEDQEEGALGFTASLVPLLCHNDSTRQLMGVNMIRQWLPLPDPEPPLVRSGHEPEDGSASLGRNLLTAYAHWKGMNYEDAVVVSESAAARLASPEPLEVGDKLSSRHGAKGVVGAILPDDEMPHLPDGRPADIVFDATGLYSRLNFGQVIEATLGVVAEKRKQPFVAPPFRRTTSEELHSLLREAGLPESGQFTLCDGKGGQPLDEPSTVGIVYWGKLVHQARPKMRHALLGPSEFIGMRAGRFEYLALRAAGGVENILDAFSTRSPLREEANALLEKVAGGFLSDRAPAPSPAFRRVQKALRTAMIDLAWQGDEVKVSWAVPGERDLALAESLEHPWRAGAELTHLGPASAGSDLYQRVAAANERLAQTLNAGVHESVPSAARAALRRAVEDLFAELLSSCAVEFVAQSQFTARAVIAPGYDLRLGQVGLAEDIAWALFGPLAAGKVGADGVRSRSKQARHAVEKLMKESVVVINRAPTSEPTCITAFTPVMAVGRCIRLHPLCCRMFNADFDGDQAAVWLPISEAAQREAKEKLTLVGHLRRDPGVVTFHLAPSHSILAGLACALESPEGRAEFEALWPRECPLPDGPLTRPGLVARLEEAVDKSGPETLLALLEKLYELGIARATRSGASLSPFVGEGLRLPPAPASDYPASWEAYRSIVDRAIVEQAETDRTLTAPVRAARTGARGSVAHIRATVGPWTVSSPHDADGPITSGFRDGLTAEELWAWTARARTALQDVHEALAVLGRKLAAPSGALTLLRRAMNSENPGRVFAEAADARATDPLSDADVRLWVGLLPIGEG